MNGRMKPEQIQAGKSYLLRGRYIVAPAVVRKVEAIEGDKVVIDVRGKLKKFPLRVFADMAVEEVEG